MLAPVISMQNVELVYEDLFYFDNLGSEISDVFSKLHPSNGFNTTSYRFNVEKFHVFKNIRIPPISKSSMVLPLDPDPLLEKLKRVHLQGYIWLDALKANLLSFSAECYGWKARVNHNVNVIYWKLTATIYCK